MKVNASTRRRFLRHSVAAAATIRILPRHVLGGPRFVPPSEKVNVAVVGVGGRGLQNLRELLALPEAQVVAVADPARSSSLEAFYYKGFGGRAPAQAAVEKHYGARTPGFRCAAYEDFRVLLEREKGVDAVLCATPDHLHAYVTLRSLRAGKHVYCEKPLTHNLWEAREVARVARETGLATQTGNQGHSTVGIRETVEHIRAGTIGRVREVHAWVGTKRWNPGLTTRPEGRPAVPEGLNWDLWLGPRSPRDYHPAYHPVAWRDFWDFGGSSLGDFACHDLDAATWALDLPLPTRVEAHSAGPTDAEIAPHGSIVYYDFPARGDLPPVRLTWYDGGLRPAAPAVLGGFPLPGRGVLFVGEKGVIQCDGAGGSPRLFPESLRQAPKPAATLVRSQGHHRDWINACKGGAPASSAFAYGAHLTELAHLGNLALRLKKPIAWDAAKLSVPGRPEADAIIRGTYRAGWELG